MLAARGKRTSISFSTLSSMAINKKRLVKVIHNKDLVSKKNGATQSCLNVLLVKSDGSINVTGFEKVNECLDEISPWQSLCKFWNNKKKESILNNRKINACKLQGRGIINQARQ